MTRLRRALRTRPGEEGFTLIEFIVATGVMLVGIVAMLSTTLAGFRGIATARQRQTANSLANQTVEQVRALPFDTVKLGLSNADLAGTTDSRIDKTGGPSVYRYGGEQIPHGDNASVVPLVPHQQTVTKGNLTYTVSAYLTFYQDVQTSNTYRLTVIVTWPALSGGVSSSVKVQTVLYSPTGPASATHPFVAPTQAFLYWSASVQIAHVYLTSTDPNVPFDYGEVVLPVQSSSTQIEQIQAVQGSARTSGVTLKLTDQAEQGLGLQQATSGADNDPGQPKPSYQIASTPAQAAGSLIVNWNNNSNRLTSTVSAGDVASTMSTVGAITASQPCPLLVPSSSFDLAQNDNQPCGNSKGQQGGALSSVLSVTAGASVNTTLVSVAASTTPSGAFTNRDTAPETTVCTLTSGDGCIQSKQYRTLGTVIEVQPPLGIAGLPGYDPSKGMIKLTGYSDAATSEAGIGAAAPTATILSGTIEYYNGTGYSTMTPGPTPARIPFGLQGNGVVAGSAAAIQISVTGDLWTGGTSVTDPAAGCTSPCTRTQASATVRSPLVGYLTYTISYLGSPLSTITVATDLGTLVANSSYTAAPSG